MDEKKLRSYINKCINDACASEERDNDVEYQYRIIGKHLLFAIRSKYQRVRSRVEYRLLKNLPRNFGLDFNLVWPDALHENYECFHATAFDLYAQSNGVDPNHSIDEWIVFGKRYTIRAYLGIRPDSEMGEPHLKKLLQHGYDYTGEQKWPDFKAAYEAAYGITPLQGFENGEKKDG